VRAMIEKNETDIVSAVKATSISFGDVTNDMLNIGGYALAIAVTKV